MPAVNFTLLRDKRDELDLSNPDLAAKVKCSTRYLENVLYGIDPPSMRLIHRFARELDLDVDQIVAAKPTGDPSDPPKQPSRPAGPARRQDIETTKKGPKRPDGALPVAS
jgi:transcriptional regulator with XRE-family HTH domain